MEDKTKRGPPPVEAVVVDEKDGDIGIDWTTYPAARPSSGSFVSPPFSTCSHRGNPIRVGPYVVFAGGTRDLKAEDFTGMDVLIPLTQSMPVALFGQRHEVLAMPLVDFGGVPKGWGRFLRKQVIPLLADGKQVLAFCIGSHGRTGTFLASLIAILEPETEDPIAAARERHCKKAVESRAQAEAIFALRQQKLPEKYLKEFAHRASISTFHSVGGSRKRGLRSYFEEKFGKK